MAMLAVQVDHRLCRDRIKLAINSGQSLMIWGHPGIGKTEVCIAVAESMGYTPVVVRPADFDAIDAKGMPYKIEVDGDTVTAYATPSWFPRAGCGKIVIVLDDFPQAPSTVQPVWSRLEHEGVLGEHKLPGFKTPDANGDHCVVLLTGNPHTDRAGSYRMPSHVANRSAHVSLEYDSNDDHVEQWSVWADANQVNGRIVSVCRFRSEMFYDFDPKRLEYAYPTARSWVAVSNDVKDIESDNEALMQIVSASWVGEASGIEFAGYCKSLANLPDIDGILEGKVSDVPEGAGLQYALVTFLSRRATVDNLENVWAYMSGMDEDYQIMWYKSVASKKEFDITQTGVGTECTVKLGDLIL